MQVLIWVAGQSLLLQLCCTCVRWAGAAVLHHLVLGMGCGQHQLALLVFAYRQCADFGLPSADRAAAAAVLPRAVRSPFVSQSSMQAPVLCCAVVA